MFCGWPGSRSSDLPITPAALRDLAAANEVVSVRTVVRRAERRELLLTSSMMRCLQQGRLRSSENLAKVLASVTRTLYADVGIA